MDLRGVEAPSAYGPVEDEYRAVREAVGVIDLGTLGRLDVKGRDAPRGCSTLCTRTSSRSCSQERAGTGVICDDAGIILDDGTVTRLSEDHYFITTSTGNVDFVEQWLQWWIAAQGLDAHVTNLTDGLAAVERGRPGGIRDLLEETDQRRASQARLFPI